MLLRAVKKKNKRLLYLFSTQYSELEPVYVKTNCDDYEISNLIA